MVDMKRIVLSLVILVASAFTMQAQEIQEVELKRQGDWMSVKMNIDMEGAFPRSNETVILTPELRHGRYTQPLKAVGVYSRNQWYYYQRTGVKPGGEDEMSFRRSQVPDVLQYETMVPYRSWMDGAKLYLVRDSKGCCGDKKAEQSENYLAFFQDDTQVTDTIYIDRTVVVEKESRTRSINGRAFVDFPLNDINIDPQYHSNNTELGYLRASIDSVSNNPAWSIRKIWIKGFASPEGPYERNAQLAEGRTKAIRDYVVSLYSIEDALMEVEFEPENWEGLRSFVEASTLSHRTEILEIIDGDREPDDKEWMIKSRYPSDWKTLHEQCLPFLRRTDYRIDYDINENNQ